MNKVKKYFSNCPVHSVNLPLLFRCKSESCQRDICLMCKYKGHIDHIVVPLYTGDEFDDDDEKNDNYDDQLLSLQKTVEQLQELHASSTSAVKDSKAKIQKIEIILSHVKSIIETALTVGNQLSTGIETAYKKETKKYPKNKENRLLQRERLKPTKPVSTERTKNNLDTSSRPYQNICNTSLQSIPDTRPKEQPIWAKRCLRKIDAFREKPVHNVATDTGVYERKNHKTSQIRRPKSSQPVLTESFLKNKTKSNLDTSSRPYQNMCNTSLQNIPDTRPKEQPIWAKRCSRKIDAFREQPVHRKIERGTIPESQTDGGYYDVTTDYRIYDKLPPIGRPKSSQPVLTESFLKNKTKSNLDTSSRSYQNVRNTNISLPSIINRDTKPKTQPKRFSSRNGALGEKSMFKESSNAVPTQTEFWFEQTEQIVTLKTTKLTGVIKKWD